MEKDVKPVLREENNKTKQVLVKDWEVQEKNGNYLLKHRFGSMV